MCFRSLGCHVVTHVRAAGARSNALSFRTPLRGNEEGKTTEDRRALEPDKPRGDDARLELGARVPGQRVRPTAGPMVNSAY